MPPRINDYTRYLWQLLSGFRVEHELKLAKLREIDIAPCLPGAKRLRVLDLANGRLRPQSMILQRDGHQVVGVDLVNRHRYRFVDLAYAGARFLYCFKLGWSEKGLGGVFVCGNVTALPFADQSFDLVTSVAALEHFLDVPAVVREAHRVLRTGGLAWVVIHLFSSLSGGHNISLSETPLRTIPDGIDPWDHLRKRRLPFTVPLNEWRMQQYQNAFATRFEIVKSYCAMREGEELLTPALLAELKEFSQDELTCGAFVILARKVLGK